MKDQKTFLVVVALVFTSSFVKAQEYSPYQIGIYTGAALYIGDLTPSVGGAYKSPGLVLGINGHKVLNPAFTLRADLVFAKVKANDSNYSKPEWRKQRNFNFNTRITELSVSMMYHPLPYRRLNPYLFVGVGYSFLKVSYDYSRFNGEYFSTEPQIITGLAADAEHGTPRGKLILPLGAGLSYALSNRLSLTAETSYRLISTDHLDGFSEAANPKEKDSYYSHNIGVVWKFPGKNKLACPKN